VRVVVVAETKGSGGQTRTVSPGEDEWIARTPLALGFPEESLTPAHCSPWLVRAARDGRSKKAAARRRFVSTLCAIRITQNYTIINTKKIHVHSELEYMAARRESSNDDRRLMIIILMMRMCSIDGRDGGAFCLMMVSSSSNQV